MAHDHSHTHAHAGFGADRAPHYDAQADPVAWTGTWQDPRFSPPADGGKPQNALTGQLFQVNSGIEKIG